MRVPGKNVMLGGLMGLWATVAAVQVSSLPELSEVPLTYTSGQPVAKAATSHVAKDALELRPMRIVAAHLPSTPKRNIFEAAETPTSDKRLVRAAVNKKEVPSPIPVVAMPVVPFGEGGPAAERGDFTVGGRIPINPSGGCRIDIDPSSG